MTEQRNIHRLKVGTTDRRWLPLDNTEYYPAHLLSPEWRDFLTETIRLFTAVANLKPQRITSKTFSIIFHHLLSSVGFEEAKTPPPDAG